MSKRLWPCHSNFRLTFSGAWLFGGSARERAFLIGVSSALPSYFPPTGRVPVSIDREYGEDCGAGPKWLHLLATDVYCLDVASPAKLRILTHLFHSYA